jgi:hypothetical protein
MFQGQFDLETATAVDATAIPDVLFERGLYWASGRAGVDAVALRREVAELMSEAEIATAQREARAWMTAQ